MLRNGLLALAGLALLGLLIFLIMQSRSVDAEYYVEYGEQVNTLRQSQTDYAALTEALQNAYRDGRPVPGSVEVIIDRLLRGSDTLAAELGGADGAVASSLSSYRNELERTIEASREFIGYQQQLSAAVATLRNDSPPIVRDLRRYDLQEVSQNTFTLAVEALDYASGSADISPDTIAQRIEYLAANPAVRERAPGRLDSLLAAARTILDRRPEAGRALEAVRDSQLDVRGQSLYAALADRNRRIVSASDRAGTLLAVFSLLLLGGLGYIATRLHQSYRELNASNMELETLNTSLEQRVEARTEQLSQAYEELKESQAQLVHAEKMSSLGELVAGISHEINTPLWYLLSNATMIKERLESFNGFVGVADDMLARLRGGSQDKQAFLDCLRELDRMVNHDGLRDDLEESQDLVQDSIEGLEQLAEMAQSLKDFSRLDRATVGEFNVNEGLDKSLLIAKNALKNKVTVQKHYGEVADIKCAPSQINQVFLNLIKNAADAIEDEGTIDITTGQEGDRVFVRIADSGSGIPEDVIAKIRDPFFTTKEVGKGTGLGLSIVDKIITSHFGEMQIESTPGEGSVFTVILPIEKPAERPEEESAGSASAAAPEEAPAESSDESSRERPGEGDTPLVAAV